MSEAAKVPRHETDVLGNAVRLPFENGNVLTVDADGTVKIDKYNHLRDGHPQKIEGTVAEIFASEENIDPQIIIALAAHDIRRARDEKITPLATMTEDSEERAIPAYLLDAKLNHEGLEEAG